MLPVVTLLRDNKKFRKLCTRLNKDFGCKSAFGCSIACPLWIAKEIEWLINIKGMTLGEAYKATIRSFVGNEDDKMKIFVEAIKREKDYPEKTMIEIITDMKDEA